ncbi:phosphate ABC transporter substrate-binding/OmpA family protein [Tabrizicola sp.]|uniref:phosphate ABC transporter substrate-binding/OmpA family protein n=1 Tax=Tabrizicola sp. TaxID=2005166 RepID=UPI003F2B3DF4
MRIQSSLRLGVAIAALFWATSLSAETGPKIKLVSKEGGITIEGEFIAIDGGNYVIGTSIGEMRVPMASVDCVGECPDLTAAPAAEPEPAAPATTEAATAEPAAPAETAPVAAAEPAAPVAAEEPAPEAVAAVPDAPADRKFGIHGSRTLGTNLMPNLIKAYAAKIGATYEMFDDNPKERIVRLTAADGSVIAQIDLQTKGSGTAFPGLGEGLADIGMADRRMNDKDLEKLGTLGELRDTTSEITLGRDGIVTMVHPSNPLQNISFEELSRIFSGEATNWRDFGGPDLPIVLHSFPDGSGDRSIFLSRAVEPFGKMESEAAVEHEEYADIRNAVAADPAAIGFLGRSFITDEVKVLPIREQCGLVSEPTNFRMKTEGYAMSRRIYLYRQPGTINPVAQDLLDFAMTPEGQQVIVGSNFVDNELETLRLSDMATELDFAKTEEDFRPDVFDALLTDLGQAERLSIAFRFPFSKATLDPLSQRSVQEFAAKLQSGAFDGKEILVVGFADAVGSFGQNQRLALARAATVADMISLKIGADDAKRFGLKPLSFGELLPYLCNEDEFGRDANRRVEIWIR